MNEGMQVYLNLNLEPDLEQYLRNNDILQKLDKLLLSNGMVYSGYRNIYYPQNKRDRDQAVIRAIQAMKHEEWLNGIYQYSVVMNITNVCGLKDINIKRMSSPSEKKWTYYENYYLQKKKCPHGIVVDENRNIRDGFVAYCLAQKFGFSPEIYEAWSNQPLRKIVTGRHIRLNDTHARISCSKTYQWIYTLRAPVVKGDILLAATKKGYSPIVVDNIFYNTGRETLYPLREIKEKLVEWDRVGW